MDDVIEEAERYYANLREMEIDQERSTLSETDKPPVLKDLDFLTEPINSTNDP